ncbi:hypothetical protein [Blastococcus saxobsidens]|uniref:Uncharacterized protein n=1 Tax=Blastococcus saxobsidens TaxID=138336 RepID=A0A4Q7Y2K6_9ACTN|nr:hypothetical protein [Blastococcus saxobsidens]RZU31040.1 hypothetical protein BKA19_0684 [Blastococcus saxobsidens]
MPIGQLLVRPRERFAHADDERSRLGTPLADAAVSRRAEFAADRSAADHGLSLELAPHSTLDGGRSAVSG